MDEGLSSNEVGGMLEIFDATVRRSDEDRFSGLLGTYGEWSPYSGEMLCHRLMSESERGAEVVARHIAERNALDDVGRRTLTTLLVRYDQVEARLSSDIEAFEGGLCCADKAHAIIRTLVSDLIAEDGTEGASPSWSATKAGSTDAWVGYADALVGFVGGESTVRDLFERFQAVTRCYSANN
jgi:hypothetical protein